MKLLVIILLFLSTSIKAQYTRDTLNYSGGFNMLGKNLLKYLANYDLEIKTSTFYLADINFDKNCKISGISLFVAGDTNFNSVIIRAIVSTENNWSSTHSHSWRLSIPIYLFKNDANGWHASAPTLGVQYAVFNNKSQDDSNIKLQPVEITLFPPMRSTVNASDTGH